MATVTTCPTCGKALAPSSDGKGFAPCSNPVCARPADALPGAGRAFGARPSARTRGSRPELLDRLPTSVWISPPILLAGGACALLYGLVLFGVVASHRRAPKPPPIVFVPRRIPTRAPERPESRPAHETPTPPPKPVETATKDTPKKGAASAEVKKPPRKAAAKAEVARATPGVRKSKSNTPKEAPAPVVVAPRPRATWGMLLADPTDCVIRPEGSDVIFELPGGLHVLSPELKLMNAPRLLTTARGDWLTHVTFPGKRPSPGPMPLPKLPFTYAGAGLIVWQSETNYLVLFRASMYLVAEGKRAHRIVMEYNRDGRISSAFRDASDGDIVLRLERRGQVIRGLYTPDGRNWIEVKRQPVTFSDDVQVGVSASNASPKPFEAHLANFELVPGTPPAIK